jgi:hypothetical protein
VIKFAFYGRVSTEDQQDPESSRGWQLTRSRTLIEVMRASSTAWRKHAGVSARLRARR